jgi:hypothetical protein
MNKDWLRKKYIDERLSCDKIGMLINMSRQSVWKALKRYDIPTRKKTDAIIRLPQKQREPLQCRISQGYFWIYNPRHPKANGLYVKRAILVLEEKLGRPLAKEEMSHHKDEDRMNDNPDNLEVTTRSEHMKIHRPISYRWESRRFSLSTREK